MKKRSPVYPALKYLLLSTAIFLVTESLWAQVDHTQAAIDDITASTGPSLNEIPDSSDLALRKLVEGDFPMPIDEGDRIQDLMQRNIFFAFNLMTQNRFEEYKINVDEAKIEQLQSAFVDFVENYSDEKHLRAITGSVRREMRKTGMTEAKILKIAQAFHFIRQSFLFKNVVSLDDIFIPPERNKRGYFGQVNCLSGLLLF